MMSTLLLLLLCSGGVVVRHVEGRIPHPKFYIVSSCGATLADCRSLCKNTTSHPSGYVAVVTSAMERNALVSAIVGAKITMVGCSKNVLVLGGYRTNRTFRWTEGPWGNWSSTSSGTPFYETGPSYTSSGGTSLMYTNWYSESRRSCSLRLLLPR
mmetsp:Transcript_66225/g.76868  ORF Transcript_66225/g.76868 Transcript_66225/m.76868 type:complete len:155 (-) Transcript_66225:167-631(-)